MRINSRLIIFTVILVAAQTFCKLAFANDLDWSGFSPFIAIALFSGFIVKEKNMSFLLPFIALVMSDAVIHLLYLNKAFAFPGFYAGQWKNYLLLLAVTILGWMLKGRTYGSLVAGVVAAPLLYFLVSNFMVWRATGEAVYAKSFDGLIDCYTKALPFYQNSLIATTVFLPLFIVSYNLLTRNKAELKLA